MIYRRITGTGSYLPGRIVTNKDLEALVETSDEWIVARTGIRERHIAADGQFTSDLALHACAPRARRRGAHAADVDLIIVATSTPDMVFPSSACLLQAKLGVKGGAAFDVQAVCTRLRLRARHRRPLHQARAAIAARSWSAPKSSRASSTGRTAAPACSSATAPAPWCSRPSDTPGILVEPPARRRHATRASSIVPGHVCGGEVQGDPTLKMDGGAVFKLAVRVLEESAREALASQRHEGRGPRRLHPAPGERAHHLATWRRSSALAESKCIVTVDRHANTSAASMPLALDVAVRDGRIRPGDLVLLQGVGGGFTWGSVLLRY